MIRMLNNTPWLRALAAKMNASEVYEKTTIAVALADALESLLQDGKITEEEGTKVFEEFKHSLTVLFEENLHPEAPTATIEGSVERYNNYMDRWSIVLRECKIELGGYTMPCPIMDLQLAETISRAKNTKKKSMARKRKAAAE